MLLDIITGNYSNHAIQSWQKAALILGVLESGKDDRVSEAKKAASLLFDTSGSWKSRPDKIDCAMLSYAVLCAAEDPDRIKKAMDYTVSMIRSNLNSEGMITYTGQKEDPDMYVDIIGLCCPFLMRYAKEYEIPEFENIAFRQIRNFHAFGLLEGTALPNHAYSWNSKEPQGVYGWGRGVGWYVIGLMDSYENTSIDENKSCLKQWISEAAESYKKYQRNDGGFGAIVQSTHDYDSSATAVLAWFYAQCAMLFDKAEYKKVAERCLQKLRRSTRINGAIDWCQGDTKGIGVFSQTYDVMPFAQGMTLRAINVIHREKY